LRDIKDATYKRAKQSSADKYSRVSEIVRNKKGSFLFLKIYSG